MVEYAIILSGCVVDLTLEAQTVQSACPECAPLLICWCIELLPSTPTWHCAMQSWALDIYHPSSLTSLPITSPCVSGNCTVNSPTPLNKFISSPYGIRWRPLTGHAPRRGRRARGLLLHHCFMCLVCTARGHKRHWTQVSYQDVPILKWLPRAADTFSTFAIV